MTCLMATYIVLTINIGTYLFRFLISLDCMQYLYTYNCMSQINVSRSTIVFSITEKNGLKKLLIHNPELIVPSNIIIMCLEKICKI